MPDRITIEVGSHCQFFELPLEGPLRIDIRYELGDEIRHLPRIYLIDSEAIVLRVLRREV